MKVWKDCRIKPHLSFQKSFITSSFINKMLMASYVDNKACGLSSKSAFDQTTCLKVQFGQYMLLTEKKYDISLHQVFKCDKKIHKLSALKLKQSGNAVTLTDYLLIGINFKVYALILIYQYPQQKGFTCSS